MILPGQGGQGFAPGEYMPGQPLPQIPARNPFPSAGNTGIAGGSMSPGQLGFPGLMNREDFLRAIHGDPGMMHPMGGPPMSAQTAQGGPPNFMQAFGGRMAPMAGQMIGRGMARPGMPPRGMQPNGSMPVGPGNPWGSGYNNPWGPSFMTAFGEPMMRR
jgi:hypothetical protein